MQASSEYGKLFEFCTILEHIQFARGHVRFVVYSYRSERFVFLLKNVF